MFAVPRRASRGVTAAYLRLLIQSARSYWRLPFLRVSTLINKLIDVFYVLTFYTFWRFVCNNGSQILSGQIVTTAPTSVVPQINIIYLMFLRSTPIRCRVISICCPKGLATIWFCLTKNCSLEALFDTFQYGFHLIILIWIQSPPIALWVV